MVAIKLNQVTQATHKEHEAKNNKINTFMSTSTFSVKDRDRERCGVYYLASIKVDIFLDAAEKSLCVMTVRDVFIKIQIVFGLILSIFQFQWWVLVPALC